MPAGFADGGGHRMSRKLGMGDSRYSGDLMMVRAMVVRGILVLAWRYL